MAIERSRFLLLFFFSLTASSSALITAAQMKRAKPKSDPTGISSRKDLPLEAVRGLAAVSVLIFHSMLAFFPQWSGLFPEVWPIEAALTGQVWFGLIYGTAAVTLFFVLSGFVLTRRFLLVGDPQIILRAVVKRWPRLAGPILVTVLASWLLFKFGAYRYAEAGAITNSPWLSKFGYAFQYYTGAFTPSFASAFLQGVFSVFFLGEHYYDSSLWTIQIEFIGSFIAFGLALVISLAPKGAHRLRLSVLGMVFLLCFFLKPLYASFPAGVGLAAFLLEKKWKLPVWLVYFAILLAIYLFGFSGSEVGAFRWLFKIFGSDPVLAQILASMLLIVAIELAPDSLRSRLSGRFAELIGLVSFPLYLVHVLVICSLGAAIFIWARTFSAGISPNLIAGAVSILASFLAAIPLVFFNEAWVLWVNKATDWMLTPKPAQRGRG